jgi:hypothetical protein
MRSTAAAVLSVALVLAGCGDDGDDGAEAPSATSETTATTTATAPGDGASIHEDVLATLADDAMKGRAHQSPGSERAQAYLVEQLAQIAEPLVDGYRQPFDQGTNLLGIIPGVDLADEHLILGAHYDGLGRDGPPRRSVVIAFWDAEEVGLLGSRHYVADPVVPLESTVAYLNWDIIGANLLPSLTDVTTVIGAETGGDRMREAVAVATTGSALDHLQLSLLFGQGRSDHAPFAAARVPVAFFSDATSGCYHTAQDDLDAVDPGKLAAQIDTGEALVRELLDGDDVPTFVPDAPMATFDDARSMLEVVSRGQADFDRFPPRARRP